MRLGDSVTDLALSFLGRLNGLITHNLHKHNVLKLIFWWSAVEKIEGDYVEFGVATGNSLRSAVIAERNSYSKKLKISRVKRMLHGFDTFKGFQSNSSKDDHPSWKGESFSKSLTSVKKRFKKNRNVYLYQGDVLSYRNDFNPKGEYIFPKDVKRIAIAMFDMDLYAPTRNALETIESLIDVGSILIFDEFFGFKGSKSSGEYLAFSEFREKYPNLEFREFIRYGMGGVSFILTSR